MPAHVVHECCIFRGNVSLVLRGVCLQENIYIFSTRKKRVERRPCSVKTNPRERCRQQLDGAALCKKKNTWSHPVRAPKAAVTSTSPGSSESQRTGKPLREGGGGMGLEGGMTACHLMGQKPRQYLQCLGPGKYKRFFTL